MAGKRIERDAVRLPLGLAVALLFLTGIVYGLSYSLTLVAITDGVPFLAFVFWMGIGAAAVMFLLSLGTGRLPPFSLAHVKAYAVAGITGFGVPFLAVAYVTGKGVPAGIVSMLVALSPILTYVGAVLFRLETPWWVRFVGFFIGIGGVAVLVVPDASLPSPDLVPWILLALLIPLGYTATGLVTAMMRPPETDSLHFGAGYFFFGALPMLIGMAASGEWWWVSGTMSTGEWALVTVVFLQALGIYLFAELIRTMGPVFFSTVNFVVPLAGIGWGVAFFGESHSGWVWIALILLMVGLLFVIQQRKRRAPVIVIDKGRVMDS